MADFNALQALINAYIKQNGVKAITGQVLNGVLTGMVSALGKGYTVAGEASPTTDPGTMTGPVSYIAHTAGTYTHFGNLVVEQGEVAMLIFDEAEWHKEVLLSLSADATIDGNVGTPEVGVSFVDGVLTFDFRNMKGNPGVDGLDGAAAGFGSVTATVDANIGTPAVEVQTSGPDTGKNFAFAFRNLKGETGVTSVVVTVDNTTGTPSCAVSLVGQVLHLDFTGLKGAQGDTGSSVEYPFTIVNNLTTDDATQALSAAMGVQLESEVSQLEAKVTDLTTIAKTEDERISSKYINKNTGALVSGAYTSNVYKYYGIIPGYDYLISGYTGANLDTCLGAWYDEDGVFISSFVPSTGVATNHTNKEQTAPANATQLCVFGSSSGNMPAVSYFVGQKVKELDVEINGNITEIDYSNINTYSNLKYDGTLLSSAYENVVVCEYPIIAGKTYKVNGRVGSVADSCLAVFLDTNSVALAHYYDTTGSGKSYENVEIVAPDGAVLLKVAGNTTSENAKVVLVETGIAERTNNIETRLDEISVNVEELNRSITPETELSPIAQYESQYINKNTGELVSGAPTSYVLEYNIEDTTQVFLASGRIGANTDTCLVAYYTQEGVFISSEFGSYGTATVYTKERLTVPPTCAKIRVFGYHLGDTIYPAELYTYANISELVPELADRTKCKNQGKSVGVFGGSLSVNSESQTAKNIWRLKLGVVVTDYGVPGAGFSSLQGTSIQTQVDGATSKDVYILWASTNDYRNNRECGTWKDYTIEDNYDESKLVTQCGGINYCIKKLLTINPKAEIYFFTPLRFFSTESGYNPFSEETNTTGKTFSEYIAEMKKCCDYYGIPTLDQYDLQGVNIFNKSLYYKTDNLHMNEAGYEKIGWVQADFLANGE